MVGRRRTAGFEAAGEGRTTTLDRDQAAPLARFNTFAAGAPSPGSTRLDAPPTPRSRLHAHHLTVGRTVQGQGRGREGSMVSLPFVRLGAFAWLRSWQPRAGNACCLRHACSPEQSKGQSD